MEELTLALIGFGVFIYIAVLIGHKWGENGIMGVIIVTLIILAIFFWELSLTLLIGYIVFTGSKFIIEKLKG